MNNQTKCIENPQNSSKTNAEQSDQYYFAFNLRVNMVYHETNQKDKYQDTHTQAT